MIARECAAMYVKVHEQDGRCVVAVCDEELLGKKLVGGKMVLDLAAYGSFYAGEKAGEREVLQLLVGQENVNLVGKKSIEAARKAGIDVSSAIDIGGVPHLQAYKV